MNGFSLLKFLIIIITLAIVLSIFSDLTRTDGDIFIVTWYFLVLFILLWNNNVRKVWFFIVPIFITIIFLHLLDYKIYGSPEIYENEVLTNPIKVVRLEYPNKIVADNKKVFEIQNVEIPMDFFLEKEWFGRYIFGMTSNWYIEVNGKDIYVQRRINYFCGNTFFPRFFPKKLPAYARIKIDKLFDGI